MMEFPIMDGYSNSHVHSTGSDGLLTPKQIIEESLRCELANVSFAEHHRLSGSKILDGMFSYPGADVKELQKLKAEYASYYSDAHFGKLQKLKTEYVNKIAISIGVEMDWFEEYAKHIGQEISKRNYDFALGSIHFLKFKDNPNYTTIHKIDSQTKFFLQSYGGIEGVIREYYKQTRLMAESKLFDCIGHIDRIKSSFGHLFSGKESWYIKEIEETLDTIKDVGICAEINTSGLNHPPSNEMYPSENIIRKMNERNIPITIGTDGHKSPVNYTLKKGYDLAKRAGYKAVNFFQGRERREISI